MHKTLTGRKGRLPGGGYILGKGRRMQVVQRDFFETVVIEDIRETVVRDIFGIQS